MGNLSSFNQGLVPSTFSELTQVVGCLVDDIEAAKKFSASQVESLTVSLNSVISERDEALISLSLLKEQHELLKEQQKEQQELFKEQQKEQQEVDLQEKDELRLQCSVLQNELDLLKREVSIKSAELERSKTEISRGQQETSTILRQLHQLQSELELYFLLSRDQSKLLEASAQLQSRSTALLLKATI